MVESLERSTRVLKVAASNAGGSYRILSKPSSVYPIRIGEAAGGKAEGCCLITEMC